MTFAKGQVSSQQLNGLAMGDGTVGTAELYSRMHCRLYLQVLPQSQPKMCDVLSYAVLGVVCSNITVWENRHTLGHVCTTRA